MSLPSTTAASQNHAAVVRKPLLGGARFEWCAIVATIWLLVGGYADAWSHIHVPQLESFFTPWHAALYSGVLAVAVVLLGTVALNRWRGYSWREAIPAGYEVAVWGVILTLVSGGADAAWHTLFGIERNIDAQLSPSHIGAMIGVGCIATGLYRSLYRKRDGQQLWLYLPIAQILFLGLIHLLTQLIHPYENFFPATTHASDPDAQLLGVVGYLFYGLILSMLNLFTIQRWKLPLGFFAVVYTVTAVPLSIMRDQYDVIAIAIVTGLLTDVLYQVIQPSTARPLAFRIFAFASISLYYLIYFLAVGLLFGVIWTIHLSGGTIVAAGIFAWLLSYLVIPLEREE